jgi:O-antigen/teichoic acid export membrane protein
MVAINSPDAPTEDAGAPNAADEPVAAIVRPSRKGARLFFAAAMTSQIAALVRYVFLARLLGPEQLGLAATLMVTASFFDLVSDTGADRFLIQDRFGDREDVQSLVHLAYVIRGTVTAIAMVAFCVPLAAVYRAPQLAVGFAFLAISPFVRGFLHLDIKRAQRRFDFRPEARRLIASELIGLVVLIAAAWFERNFYAVIWGVVARDLSRTLLSHLFAERPYRLHWVREAGMRLVRFSYPLMLTGLMLFIGTQGDRVVVAHWLGARSLGLYSAVLLLIYVPSFVILNYMHGLYVPMISAERDHPDRREHIIETMGGQTFVLGIVMCAGFALVAPTAVTILYGHRYTQSAFLIGAIGIMQCARFLIGWPTTVNLSLGHSRYVFASNFVRLLAYPLAYVGARLLHNLDGLVAGFAIGEFISIGIAIVLMNRGDNRPMFAGFDRLIAFGLTGLAVIGWNLALRYPNTGLFVTLIVFSALLLVLVIRREGGVMRESLDYAKRAARPLFARLSAAR